MQMLRIDFVRDEQEFHIVTFLQVTRQQSLILRPGTTRHDCLAYAELLYQGQLHFARSDGTHAIKTRITGNRHSVQTIFAEQFSRGFVLYIQACEGFQEVAVGDSPWPEEQLFWAEDSRDEEGLYLAALEFPEVCRPELILDKYRHAGFELVKERTDAPARSKRQIGYQINHGIVLAHFIARWGEEGKKHPFPGVFLFEALNDRTSLLKLTYGGCMEPYGSVISMVFILRLPSAACFAYFLQCLCLTFDQLAGFFMPQ